jgi:hypothetical protein
LAWITSPALQNIHKSIILFYSCFWPLYEGTYHMQNKLNKNWNW